MKRALIIATVSGFVSQFEMDHIQILKELGYEIHYASNFYHPHYGIDNHRLDGTGMILHQVDFVRSPFRIWQNWRAYWQLRKLMKEISFQLVHCHTPMGGVLGRLAARKEQKKKGKEAVKIFYTVHGFHFFRGASFKNWLFYYPVEWWLAGITDVLITITEEDYKQAKKFSKIASDHVYHIHGVGVETEQFQNEREFQKEQEKAQYGMEKDTILFLSVGELNRNKNHIMMIRALAKIKDKQMYYFICGEGKERKKLQREIKRFGLEKRVFLFGYQEDISSFLKCADIYVALSYREGLSLGIQEAMAAGLPILASDIRGNNELVIPESGGWLLKPSDKKRLCFILKKIQKESSSDYLGKKGRFNQERIKAYEKAVTNKEMKQIYLENISKGND